jgi:hypothetical protein
MSETRKIAPILVADIVGYSRLAGADEDRTLSRLSALRSDLIDPTIAGAPKGNRIALKHGACSAETLALKREIQALARMTRETIAGIMIFVGPCRVLSALVGLRSDAEFEAVLSDAD